MPDVRPRFASPAWRVRAGVLAAMTLGVAAVFAPGLLRAVAPQALAAPTAPRLAYNASASIPGGFYLITAQPPRVGDVILTRLPAAVAQLAAARHYLPAGVPLIKPIAAGYGDHVCVRDGIVRINGRGVARTLAADRLGRPLAAWPGCRLLGPDEWFLLGVGRPDSFDSRYFGPIPRTAAFGRAVPLWVWGAP